MGFGKLEPQSRRPVKETAMLKSNVCGVEQEDGQIDPQEGCLQENDKGFMRIDGVLESMKKA